MVAEIPRFDTVFQEEWWLDAAAPGQWEAVTVESGGELQARLPFVIRRSGSQTVLTQPQLTQSLGPWVRDTGAGYARSMSRQMDLYSQLIDKLPPHTVFRQNFAPQVTNWLPFYWEGYTQTTRYTYTIDLKQDLDTIKANMDKRNRSRLRSAERELRVEISETGLIDELLDMAEMTFARQGLALPYPRELVHRIDEAVKANAKRWVIVCRDRHTGDIHSADYAVGDERRIYALISGADPALRDSGAGVLARWHAIQRAREHAAVYDMEGSMIKPIEHRNRKYGAVQVPYMALSRAEPPPLAARIGDQARRAVGRVLRGVRGRLERT